MQASGSLELIRTRYREAEVVQRGGELLHKVPVLLSSDGKWVFVCCGSRVQVYSHSTCQMVSSLQHAGPVTATLLNPKNDLQLITSSLSGHLSWWDYMNAAILRTVDFGVALHKFAIRPGKLEPSIFFVIKKEEMSIVGVSSHVITQRNPTTPPSKQIQDALPLVTTNNTPRDILFTPQGAHLVTFNESGSRLVVYNFDTETQHKYKNRQRVTAVACHPTELCIATGNRKGEIYLWFDFAKTGVQEAIKTLHWHAHAVSHLCFTTDGTYLLSGGEEGVLVVWQLQKSQKQFRPRLGSAITSISCGPNDAYFAVSLLNNVVKLVSGLNSDLEGTLGGLKKAYVNVTTPEENGVRTGLVLRPHSKSLVLNSTPGFLQSYDTETQALSTEIDVVGLNFVSRADKDPIIPTTVDHVAFSPSGDWMATVESRDDGKTAPELRMKFWKFVTSQQKYLENTCVDPPHDRPVTSLCFQPSLHHSSTSASLHAADEATPLVVSTSLDQRFKVWLLVEREGGEEEREGKKRRKVSSWTCRSVSSYRGLPCTDAAFSQDGSLLAVNWSKDVTVWDPYSCSLRQTFTSPHKEEVFKQVLFGQHSCSQYLMASATHHLHVWDMLSCKLLWRVGVAVSCLVVDPWTHLAAAFVHSAEKALLYVVDPGTPQPVAVHTLPSGSQEVVGAAFVPRTLDAMKLRKLVVGESSTLFFITRDQVLLSLEVKTADSVEDVGEKSEQAAVAGHKIHPDPESVAEKAFTAIFRPRKRLNGVNTSSSAASSLQQHHHQPTPTPAALRLLDAPPHVLPPPTSLCTHLMKRLLPLALPPSVGGHASSRRGEDSSDDEEEVEEGRDRLSSGEEEEEEVRQPHKKIHRESLLQHPIEESGCVLHEGSGRVPVNCKASNYEWLVNYFQKTT